MAPCDTSGSGAELPSDPNDLLVTHGPLPESTSLFMGFVFMLTTSSDIDSKSNQKTSDGEEGETRAFSSQLNFFFCFKLWTVCQTLQFLSTDYVQTAPYNQQYTTRQLEAGGGMILPEFNDEQVRSRLWPVVFQNLSAALQVSQV